MLNKFKFFSDQRRIESRNRFKALKRIWIPKKYYFFNDKSLIGNCNSLLNIIATKFSTSMSCKGSSVPSKIWASAKLPKLVWKNENLPKTST